MKPKTETGKKSVSSSTIIPKEIVWDLKKKIAIVPIDDTMIEVVKKHMAKQNSFNPKFKWKLKIEESLGMFMCQQCGFETKEEKSAQEHLDNNTPDKKGFVHFID